MLEHPAVDGPQGSLFFFSVGALFSVLGNGERFSLFAKSLAFSAQLQIIIALCMCVYGGGTTNTQTHRHAGLEMDVAMRSLMLLFVCSVQR